MKPIERYQSRLLIIAGVFFLAGMDRCTPPVVDVTTIPDVPLQYSQLKHHGEWLGFHIGAGTPDPTPRTGAAHWQGIGRYQDSSDTPYMIVSLNAKKNSGHPGGLAVARMESRPNHGERMRSNRLKKGSETEDTPPPPTDVVVKWFQLPTFYDHPGGIQVIGDLVAIAMVNADENRSTLGHPDGAVMFVDLSGLPDIGRLNLLPHIHGIAVTADRAINRIGAVGITQLLDGRFLLVAQNLKGDWLHFYKSNADSYEELVKGLSFSNSPHVVFSHLDSWSSEEIVGKWYREKTGDPTSASFQMLNLVTQQDGRIFLIGARNKNKAAPFFGGNEDRLQLYEVQGYDSGKEIVVRSVGKREGKHMFLRNAGSGLNGNFNAAAGLYVSPTGELLVYAAEHDNDGTPGGPDGFIRMAEFRNELMNRADSPLYPRPWVELFEHDNFQGRSIVLDWDDRAFEDWQDFGELDGSTRGFHDQVSSVRWYAPVGCRIGLYEQDSFRGRILTLEGSGSVRGYSDLSDVTFDLSEDPAEDEISSTRFLGPTSRCKSP